MRSPNASSRCLLPSALLAAGVLAAAPAHASDSVGVYASVRKVKFEPDSSAPVRVRVCGAFALANVNAGVYFAPAAGYMYYSCPTGKEALCKMQWTELAMAAASGKCVGYGQRRDSNFMPANNGTVRQASVQPANPDPYPIELGVVQPATTDGKDSCTAAQAALVDAAPCENPVVTGDMAQSLTPDMRPGPMPTDPAVTGGSKSCAYGQRSAGVQGAVFTALGIALLAATRRRRILPRG